MSVEVFEVVEVDDPSDPRVADYVGLTDPDLRRLRESGDAEGGGFFIAEGALVIRTLLSSPYPVRSLLLTPVRLGALRNELSTSLGSGVPVYVAGQDVVNAISGFALHRGALASADRLALVDAASLCRGASLVVATEGMNDHENLGALFRNCAAFGVDGVLLDDRSCDPLYRRAVRVSMGHVLRVPFTRLSSVDLLSELGFETIALTPSSDADDIRSLDVGSRRPRALLVGAEGPGLSAAALSRADRRVRIPMAPGVDSLNVATAAAIALHELSSSSR